MIILTGAELYDPAPRGMLDIAIAGGVVLAIDAADSLAASFPAARRMDVSGCLLLPGLVDVLTHPCGGGGEGGFGNRTAELEAKDFVAAGVTCPVGALGTDSLGRSLDVLFGSTMALREAGLNAFMYTGAYRVPAPTLTGDVARDLYLIDPVVGVGEVAVADHRGTQPSAGELRRLAGETQLGGILAGRGGTVLVHVGDGAARLTLLREAIADSDLSPATLYPTHVNRSRALLDEAAAWAQEGGYVDITVSTTPELVAAGDIPASVALRYLLDAGAPAGRITLSSDAGGSLPLYVDGVLHGLTAARPECLTQLLAQLLEGDRDLFSAALAAMTRNPAQALRIDSRAGSLAPGRRADVAVFDPASGRVRALMGAGQWLLESPGD